MGGSGDAAAAMKRGDCVADSAPIAPSCTRAAAASGTYTLREREGHRPRLQGTAIRVASSWHSALDYHSIGRNDAAARGCRLYPKVELEM